MTDSVKSPLAELREQQAQAERAELAHERAEALRVWKAAGGSDADFDKEWPRMATRKRQDRAEQRDQEARASHARFTHERF